MVNLSQPQDSKEGLYAAESLPWITVEVRYWALVFIYLEINRVIIQCFNLPHCERSYFILYTPHSKDHC